MEAALATGLFVSLCTITALPTPVTLGPSGWPTAAYVAVTGLVDIRCMKAVVAQDIGSPLAYEKKAQGDSITSNDWHVLLETYYPTITTAMRAIIDGVTFDIVGVDNDSQFSMTRIRVRQASL